MLLMRRPHERPVPSPIPFDPVTDRRWLSWAPGELPTMLWVGFLHVALVVGLVLLPLPPLSAIIAAAVALFIGGLGTTVAYHRALAHRALTIHPLVEQALICSAMFNGSGSPRSWVGTHRYHHAHSDRPSDVSSPHHGGFWWSHLRWLWQADFSGGARLVGDLDRRRYRVWTHLQPLVLAAAIGAGALWFLWVPWQQALAAMLWIGPLRLVWALHAQCSVNSVCHLGPVDAPHGSGRNVGWLAFLHLGQGENWHGNHHARPTAACIGGRGQLDLGWWMIGALRFMRLARLRREPG
jgi:stearoyl-CoA desaturase (delta-9 desaturase)